jgi:hypothetical protein
MQCCMLPVARCRVPARAVPLGRAQRTARADRCRMRSTCLQACGTARIGSPAGARGWAHPTRVQLPVIDPADCGAVPLLGARGHTAQTPTIRRACHAMACGAAVVQSVLGSTDRVLSEPPVGTALRCAALRCAALRCAALRCAALRCTGLRCTALDCAALRCTALRCTALRCTALHWTALHCTALHCSAL